MGLDYEIIEDFKGEKNIYCGKCNKIFSYSEEMERFLREYNQDTQLMIQKMHPIFTETDILEYKKCLEKYLDDYNKNIEAFCAVQNRKNKEDRRFTTLWINISNDCNMRCIYCYGDGGHYNRERELIKKNKMVEILNFWIEHIDPRKKLLRVIFFGGEPLMNKAAIKFAVAYLKVRLNEESRIQFEITTNGTIIDDELLEIFSLNNFHITLSIDGGKKIQDAQRPFLNRKGSFSVISRNIEAILKKNIPIIARVTVTHQNVGEIMQCIFDIWDLGIKYITFAPVSTEKKDIKLTSDDMDILINQIEKLGAYQYKSLINNKHRYILNMIQFGKMLHQNQFGICSFYVPEVLKVDINGNIFKCHRLIGIDDFLEGNVNQGLVMNDSNLFKAAVNSCPNCIYSTLCIPCNEMNYCANHDINITCKEYCQYSKAIIKENIKLYVSLSKDLPEQVKHIYGSN